MNTYTVTEFLTEMENEIYSNDGAFIINMNNLQHQKHTFCEWLRIFLSWMEWNTDEDCEMAYD